MIQKCDSDIKLQIMTTHSTILVLCCHLVWLYIVTLISLIFILQTYKGNKKMK